MIWKQQSERNGGGKGGGSRERRARARVFGAAERVGGDSLSGGLSRDEILQDTPSRLGVK